MQPPLARLHDKAVAIVGRILDEPDIGKLLQLRGVCRHDT
jgi:hypothetical protein